MSYVWCGCGGDPLCPVCCGTERYFDETEYSAEDWNETEEFDDETEEGAD